MNVLLTFGPATGIAVALADAGKGVLACLAGRALRATPARIGRRRRGRRALLSAAKPTRWQGHRDECGPARRDFPLRAVRSRVGVTTGALVRPGRPGRRALATTVVASTAWIAGSLVWWRKRLPNLWGVEPTGALPLASAASTAVIMSRFWHAIRHGLPDDYSPEA